MLPRRRENPVTKALDDSLGADVPGAAGPRLIDKTLFAWPYSILSNPIAVLTWQPI